MPEDEFGFGGQQTIVPPDEEQMKNLKMTKKNKI